LKFLPIIKKYNNRLLGLLLLLCVVNSSIHAQQRHQLEANRKKLIKKIQLTSQLLNETTRTKAAAFDRFVALENQIQAREELIQTLQAEAEFTTQNIERTAAVIQSLEEDIHQLEQEYGQMIRQAFRHKISQSKLFFLFSAASLNQVIRRWQYLKQYDQYRKKQSKLIIDTRAALTTKVEALEVIRIEKEELINTEKQQRDLLDEEKKAKDQILKSLRSDENRLKRELVQQRQAHEKLNGAIETMIKKEMAASRRSTRNNAKSSSGTKDISAPAKSPAIADNGEFIRFRGQLPWPVEKGVITRFFGKQAHPSLKKIEITNNGIDIRTDRNARVRAVFHGEVVGTQFIPGYNHMLILKHGNFYTVYSNLKEVSVRRGDQVKAKQPIGRVSLDPKTNISEVHFELWQNKERLNPVNWISK